LRRSVLRARIAEAFEIGPAEAVATTTAAEFRISDLIPLSVLIAEDNLVNKKVALRLLERLGYKADAVANGIEALNVLRRHSYQLVFMDVQMPEMDGLETTRRIRSTLPREQQPVIVALTANAIAGDAEVCRAAGMDDYIPKPVRPEDIHNMIIRHFGRDKGLKPVVR
jgi:CheY-like chemotaxis protein